MFEYGAEGGRKEDRREERVIPKLPEQFVTLEWLLSYPGGPLSRNGCRSRGEGLEAAESGQRSWPALASAVCPLGRRVAREEGGQRGGGQRVAACQGSIFIGMLVKPAGEISLGEHLQ